MKVSDLAAGFLVLALAAGLWWNARGLPNPGGQVFGPAAFPSLVAALLAISAAPLLVSGFRLRRREPVVALEPWARDPRNAVRFLLVPACILFFVFAVEPLGFLPTALLILLTLLLAGGVSAGRAIAIALPAVLVVHSVFYLGLGVQLPWGVLQPIAW
jgi:putative tricarboxylic transport membrane protein